MGIGIWVCLIIAFAAMVSDVATRRIPNLLTFGGILVGIGLHATIGYASGGTTGATSGALRSLIGVAVCAIIPLISFARRQMGGGDVKLFAAIGALCGPIIGLDAEGLAFLVMVVVVLPWRLWRAGGFRASARNARIAIQNLFRSRTERQAYEAIRLRPVVMGPTILVGLCAAALRHWPLLVG